MKSSVILCHKRASLVSNHRERNSSCGKFRHSPKAPARLSPSGRIRAPSPVTVPRSVRRRRCQIHLHTSDLDLGAEMLLLVVLVCFSPAALGQLEESQSADSLDLADFDFGIVGRLLMPACYFAVDFLAFLIVAFLSAGVTQSPASGESHLSQGEVRHAHFCAASNRTLTPRRDPNIEQLGFISPRK